MSYQPYSKNIIIQENFDALDEEIKEHKKLRDILSNNSDYHFSTNNNNYGQVPSVEDVMISDDKQLIVTENYVYILASLSIMTLFVFQLFHK
tara:strand:+ start:8718 stop:8993 length:276 start_codon:yes stop_codon:yes gene_type:complete